MSDPARGEGGRAWFGSEDEERTRMLPSGLLFLVLTIVTLGLYPAFYFTNRVREHFRLLLDIRKEIRGLRDELAGLRDGGKE